jgi:hypothetical protein
MLHCAADTPVYCLQSMAMHVHTSQVVFSDPSSSYSGVLGSTAPRTTFTAAWIAAAWIAGHHLLAHSNHHVTRLLRGAWWALLR